MIERIDEMDPVAEDRKLTAIVSADVFGYSRLMGSDEDETFKRLTASRKAMFSLISTHKGRVANTAGDAMLAEFGSAKDAVAAAVAIQEALAVSNEAASEERRMRFRIGVNLGDVIERAGDLFGDGVNIAARLQSLAVPGGICISSAVYDQVRRNLDLQFEDLGEQAVKNIERPIRVYKILLEHSAARFAELTAQVNTNRPSSGTDTGPSGYVIAVLPFDNMSDDPSQSYFSDGLTEDLITGLAAIKELLVPARNTMFTYKGKASDLRQIGRELGATHVVEGSVRKSGTHLRINVQLINASNGNHIWAKRFDKELTDIFEIQDAIVHSIVTEVDVQLLHGEQARSWRRSTKNAEA
jgi:adenylate cyclase